MGTIHKNTNIYIHTFITYTDTYGYIQIQTYIHTYIHTYTNIKKKYMHKHIDIFT